MPRSKASSEMKTVKKIPSSENGPGVHCITKSGEEYFITQCLEKMRFTLWHKTDGGYEQIGIEKSPLDFDKMIPWEK